MLDLLELLVGGKFPFEQYGDNQSTLRIMKTGVNNTMRHFNRQHGINLAYIHEHYVNKLMDLHTGKAAESRLQKRRERRMADDEVAEEVAADEQVAVEETEEVDAAEAE